MIKENKLKFERKLRNKRAMALSQIFLMVISSIAFAFIIGGMGILSLGGVSAVDGKFTLFVSGSGESLWVMETGGGESQSYSAGGVTYTRTTDTSLQNIDQSVAISKNIAGVSWQSGTMPTGTSAAQQITPTSAYDYLIANPGKQITIDQQTYVADAAGNIKTLQGFNLLKLPVTPEGVNSLKGVDTNGNSIISSVVLTSDPTASSASSMFPTNQAPAQAVLGGARSSGQNVQEMLNLGGKWDTLSPAQQKIATDAGWNKVSFDNEIEKPAPNINDPALKQQKLDPNANWNTGEKNYSILGLTSWSTSQYFLGNLVEGVQWAGAVIGIVNVFAGILPDSMKDNVKAFSQAVAAGILVGKASYGAFQQFGGTGWMKDSKYIPCSTASGCAMGTAAVIGLIAAYLAFAASYKKTSEKTESIEFKCMSWQAPHGGADCSKCNDNKQQPCSEYRCKSLGQTCKLINAGTGQDRCIDSSPSDTTSPGIKPWKEELTPGYAYSNVKERPAGDYAGVSGMSITYNGACLPAFTPFDFGIITTDKGEVTQAAQCKIDFNHTAKMDDMQYYFGDDNLYEEDHSQAMSLPSADLIATLYGAEANQSTLPIKNDGEYKLYVRCKDGNGNENRDEFVINFCIDKSPDVTAPIIKSTNPPAGSPVLYQVDNATVQVYTNEPSECRWSRKDASYNNMENQMQCNNDVWEMNAELLYTCNAALTGIKDKQENQFYFRCQDKSAQNNTMQESYAYSLFGTEPLTILNVGPNGTISGSTSTVTTTLTVQTDNGYKNGESRCSYSTSPTSGFIEMVNTGTSAHSQPLDLTEGNYTYYYQCIDAGGNAAVNSTNFTIYVDRSAPIVTRTYNYESKLTIATDEDSTCRYSTSSCNFDINKEGIDMPYANTQMHFAEWKTTQTYYIKCMDQNGNQPNPTECSTIVRPYRVTSDQ